MLPCGMRKPALVPNDEPDTGTLTAPGTWPAACASGSRTSRTKWPSRSTGVDGGRSADERPAVDLDDVVHVRRPRCRERTRTRRRTPRPWRGRAPGLKRRSWPIVDERSSLMPAPQSEPATCPGITRTSSGSSSSRWRLWKSPSAPSRASTARSGRAAVPTNSESPVSSASPARKQQCSGRWPGVWIVLTVIAADGDLVPVLQRLVRV